MVVQIPVQGEDEVDEDDVLDHILDQQSKAAAAALPQGGALRAARLAKAASRPVAAEESVNMDKVDANAGLGAWASRMLNRSMKGKALPGTRVAGNAGPIAEGQMGAHGSAAAFTFKNVEDARGQVGLIGNI